MPATATATATAADDLATLIKQRYRNATEFARAIDIPAHTLYSIIGDDRIGNCSLASAMAITRALDLDPYAFAEGRLQPIEATIPTPIYDEFIPGIAPNPLGHFPIPATLAKLHPGAFILRVRGNAMNRVLPNGFLALVSPNKRTKAIDRLHAISIAGAPAVIRRVIMYDNGFAIEPVSKDPTYTPRLVINGNPDAPEITHIGAVVWYCAPVG